MRLERSERTLKPRTLSYATLANDTLKKRLLGTKTAMLEVMLCNALEVMFYNALEMRRSSKNALGIIANLRRPLTWARIVKLSKPLRSSDVRMPS